MNPGSKFLLSAAMIATITGASVSYALADHNGTRTALAAGEVVSEVFKPAAYVGETPNGTPVSDALYRPSSVEPQPEVTYVSKEPVRDFSSPEGRGAFVALMLESIVSEASENYNRDSEEFVNGYNLNVDNVFLQIKVLADYMEHGYISGDTSAERMIETLTLIKDCAEPIIDKYFGNDDGSISWGEGWDLPSSFKKLHGRINSNFKNYSKMPKQKSISYDVTVAKTTLPSKFKNDHLAIAMDYY